MSQSVLNSLVLRYAPVSNRQRQTCAFWLQVQRVGSGAIDAQHLLTTLDEVWPERALLVLAIQDPALLLDTLQQMPRPNLALQVPAALAGYAHTAGLLTQAAARGHSLLYQIDAQNPAPISMAGVARVLDMQAPAGADGPTLGEQDWCFHPTTQAALQATLDAGAGAVIGWPVDDLLGSCPRIDSDTDSVRQLIALLQQEVALERMEQSLLREPLVCWRLLQQLHQSDGHMPEHVNVLRRGLMMMGYGALERWLQGQLALSVPCSDLRPLMRVSVLRGLLMEHLVQAGTEDELGREIYFCGLFSKLDRLLRQDFNELLPGLPLSERVADALIRQQGPYHAVLTLALACESESPLCTLALAQEQGLDIEAVNRALLRTLAQAILW